MLINQRRDAEVQILLVSDEPKEAHQLTRAIEAMRYRIYFRCFTSTPIPTEPICRLVLSNLPPLPTAIVIDYFLRAGRCAAVLSQLYLSCRGKPIEFVIANGPDCSRTRAELLALGARTIVSGHVRDYSSVVN
jgi:hypothetical protein